MQPCTTGVPSIDLVRRDQNAALALANQVAIGGSAVSRSRNNVRQTFCFLWANRPSPPISSRAAITGAGGDRSCRQTGGVHDGAPSWGVRLSSDWPRRRCPPPERFCQRHHFGRDAKMPDRQTRGRLRPQAGLHFVEHARPCLSAKLSQTARRPMWRKVHAPFACTGSIMIGAGSHRRSASPRVRGSPKGSMTKTAFSGRDLRDMACRSRQWQRA